MSSPLISVVIPAYNHERYVGPAIESVLSQDYSNWRLIIIDDGSTDNTAKVCQSYQDERIEYHHQHNQDAYNALNNGMAKATGDYIAILNSDDIYQPTRFSRMLATMQEKQLACAFSDVFAIDHNNEPLLDPEFGWNHWHQKNRDVYFAQDQDLYAAFLHGNFMVTTSNILMKREVFANVGGFSSLRYLHDYDYIFRIMLAYPDAVGYVHDEQLLQYRIHGGNTLSEAAILGREQDLHVIETYLLAKMPEQSRRYVDIGSQRLRALERELNEVRAQLAPQGISNKAFIHAKLRGLKARIKKRFT